MGNSPKNIIEDLTRDYLERALNMRYDICTCIICKNDMLAYALTRLQPKYITTEQGAMHTILEQTKPENEADLNKAIQSAIDIISRNPKHKMRENRQQIFELLLKKIFEERGIDFRNYHRDILKRRFALRIKANALQSYSEYLRYLLGHPEEYDKLFETLCINVTEFFRDQEVWVTIRYLLENLIRIKIQKKDKTLRIWSAACASGEEPYSLAITVKEILKDNPENISVEIWGTDIDKKCLSVCGKGKYLKGANKNLTADILKRYFVISVDNFQLKKEILDMVNFRYLDLTSADMIPSNDLILCRNAFIYFNHDLQMQMIKKFHGSLKPEGYLVLGKVETILSTPNQFFEEIDTAAHISKKK